MTKELAAFDKKVSPISAEVTNLSIESADDMTKATDLLSKLNRTLDQVEEEEDKVLAPIKEAMKAEKARWEPIKSKLKPAILLLRSKISNYQTEQMRIAKAEENKIADRVGKGTLTMDTAIRKIEAIDKPEEKVESSNGSIKFRTTQKLVITDESKIPPYYKMVNEKLLLEDMKKGISVFGAKLEEVQIPVNSR